MTQHTELIALLRANADMMPTDSHIGRQYKAAADALEATAKSAFEAMPHDIPQRMKDAICEETGWSGSMVSRMYTELRKAFTGEPYKANEDLDAALLEIEALKAQESVLCTLYGLAQAECKKLRAEVEGLRMDAACFRFWVREAAVNPCDMAKLIMRCTTEQEYRDAIEPLATAAEDAIRAAMKGQP